MGQRQLIVYLAAYLLAQVSPQTCPDSFTFPYTFGMNNDAKYDGVHTEIEEFAVVPSTKNVLVALKSTNSYFADPNTDPTNSYKQRSVVYLDGSTHAVKWSKAIIKNRVRQSYKVVAMAVRDLEDYFAVIYGITGSCSGNSCSYPRFAIRAFRISDGEFYNTKLTSPSQFSTWKIEDVHSGLATYVKSNHVLFFFNYIEGGLLRSGYFKVNMGPGTTDHQCSFQAEGGYNVMKLIKPRNDINQLDSSIILLGGFVYAVQDSQRTSLPILDAKKFLDGAETVHSFFDKGYDTARDGGKLFTQIGALNEVVGLLGFINAVDTLFLVIVTQNKPYSTYSIFDSLTDPSSVTRTTLVAREYHCNYNPETKAILSFESGDTPYPIFQKSISTKTELLCGEYVQNELNNVHLWVVRTQEQDSDFVYLNLVYANTKTVRISTIKQFVSSPNWNLVFPKNLAYNFNENSNPSFVFGFNFAGSSNSVFFGNGVTYTSNNEQGFIFSRDGTGSKQCIPSSYPDEFKILDVSRSPSSFETDEHATILNNLGGRDVYSYMVLTTDLVKETSESSNYVKAFNHEVLGSTLASIDNVEHAHIVSGQPSFFCERFYLSQTTQDTATLETLIKQATFTIPTDVEGQYTWFEFSGGGQGIRRKSSQIHGLSQTIIPFGKLTCKENCGTLDEQCGKPHLNMQSLKIESVETYRWVGQSLDYTVSDWNLVINKPTTSVSEPISVKVVRRVDLSQESSIVVGFSYSTYLIEMTHTTETISCDNDYIEYIPGYVVDSASTSGFLDGPYVFLRESPISLTLEGPATRYINTCPIVDYSLALLPKGDSSWVLFDGIDSRTTTYRDASHQNLVGCFTEFKKTKDQTEEWQMDFLRSNIKFNGFLRGIGYPIAEFWTNFVHEEVKFGFQDTPEYHGNMQFVFKPKFADGVTSKYSTKGFISPVPVIRCGEQLDPDTTQSETVLSSIKSKFQTTTSGNQLLIINPTSEKQFSWTFDAYVFCPDCGHSYCMNETVSGVTQSYPTWEKNSKEDYASTTKLAVNYVFEEGGTPSQVWKFNLDSVSSGVYSMMAAFKNMFREAYNDNFFPIKFDICVASETCSAQWQGYSTDPKEITIEVAETSNSSTVLDLTQFWSNFGDCPPQTLSIEKLGQTQATPEVPVLPEDTFDDDESEPDNDDEFGDDTDDVPADDEPVGNTDSSASSSESTTPELTPTITLQGSKLTLNYNLFESGADFGNSYSLKVSSSSNCFGQSIDLRITLKVMYCRKLEAKEGVNTTMVLPFFTGTVKNPPFFIEDSPQNLFTYELQACKPKLELIQTKDPEAPLSEMYQEIFEVDSSDGEILVDNDILDSSVNQTLSLFIKGSSPGGHIVYIPFQLIFTAKVKGNQPPYIMAKDLDITFITATFTAKSTEKVTLKAQLKDEDGDAISLVEDIVPPCMTFKVSGDTLLIEISPVKEDVIGAARVGFTDPKGSGLTTFYDFMVDILFQNSTAKKSGDPAAPPLLEDELELEDILDDLDDALDAPDGLGGDLGDLKDLDGELDDLMEDLASLDKLPPVSDDELFAAFETEADEVDFDDLSEEEAEELEKELEAELDQLEKEAEALDAISGGGSKLSATLPEWVETISVEEVEAQWSQWKKLLKREIEAEDEIEENDEEIEEDDPVEVLPTEPSRNGKVQLEFSEPLMLPLFARKLRQHNNKRRQLLTLTSLNVERDLFSSKLIMKSDVDPADVKYFITINEWTETGISVTVNFTTPLLVSQGTQNDLLILTVKQPMYFISKRTLKPLDEKHLQIIFELPKQFPSGADPKALEMQAAAASNSLMILLVAQILMQFVLKNMMDSLWSLFFSLQLLCYMKIYEFQVPSNAEIFLNELTRLIEFRSLSADSFVKLFYGDTMTAQLLVYKWVGIEESPQQALARGKTIIEELQVFILAGALLLIFLLFALLLLIVKKFRPKIQEKLIALKQKFVWNGVIRSLLISYFQLGILANSKLKIFFIFFDKPKVRSTDDLMMGIAIFLGASLVPIVLFSVLYRNQESLDSEEFKAKYKILTDNLRRSSNSWQAAGFWLYPSMFFRRWLFCLVPILFLGEAYFQFQALVMMTLGFSTSYFYLKPQIDRRRRRIEEVNEVLLALMVYHQILFTHFQNDIQLQFWSGYSYIALIVALLVANFLQIVVVIINSCQAKRNKTVNRILFTAMHTPDYSLTYWEAWTVRHFTDESTKGQIVNSLRFSKKLREKEERIRDKILKEADAADFTTLVDLKSRPTKQLSIITDSSPMSIRQKSMVSSVDSSEGKDSIAHSPLKELRRKSKRLEKAQSSDRIEHKASRKRRRTNSSIDVQKPRSRVRILEQAGQDLEVIQEEPSQTPKRSRSFRRRTQTSKY